MSYKGIEMSGLKQIGIDVDVNRVIEGHRRAFSESPNDILRRLLVRNLADRPTTTPPRASTAPESETVRRRGRWTVDRGSTRIAAGNLKEAYRSALLLLNEEFPDFLERFAEEQARSRRYVAKSPTELYLASPRLARHHAKPLVDGWFFDTNLSTDQVARRVRIAARICGIRYGADFRLLNNLEQI
jgi:hypothetical protein